MNQISLAQILKGVLSVIWDFWPLFLIVVTFSVLGLVLNFYFGTKSEKGFDYKLKDSVMTAHEREMFKVLLEVLHDRYFIFPQVHLDAFLNYKVYGQSWYTAFRRINQKSVDFLICDQFTEKPLLAIELDDRSHARRDRQERDVVVEDIFISTKLPLLRFREINKQEISSKVLEVLSKVK